MLHLIFLLICIFNIHSASSTVTTDVNPTQPCNSCCQGPSGLPEMPGPSGHNGSPGRDRFRGEKGEIGGPGVAGERGLPGPERQRGEKGDVGLQSVQGLRGHSGKVGPRGLTGTAGVGQMGPVGRKGEKGELGQKGESADRSRSAFTAVKTGGYQTGSRFDVLTFEVTKTNIGNNFDTGTSKFTCQTPGVYWFMYTMYRENTDNQQVYVDLVQNGVRINRAIFYESVSGSVWSQSSNGAVLQLEAGDQVWVRFGSNGKEVASGSPGHTTFSGFLLYED